MNIQKASFYAVKVFLLALVLLAAFLVRQSTFWLPHWRGDQEHYMALAMKLSWFGINGYNLKGIDVNSSDFEIVPGYQGTVAELLPAPKGQKGYVLSSLEQVGIKHYDNPLHHIAPAFPYALMFSNRLLGGGKFTGVRIESSRIIKYIRPKEAFGPQLYAVIVPLIFSLLTVIVTFLLAARLFSFHIGLYAAFIYAFNAVDLMTSQRVWTDDMAVFFLSLSALLFIHAFEGRKKILCAVLAGVSCGLSTLTRQNSCVIIMPLLVYMVSFLRQNNDLKWGKVLFNRINLVFLSVFLITVFPWFWKVFSVYGNPIYTPDSSVSAGEEAWYGLLARRPPSIFLYTVGMLCITPVFAFAYSVLKRFFLAVDDFRKGCLDRVGTGLIFLFAWVLTFILLFTVVFPGKEHRYILPAYPALAVLSAWGIFRARLFVLNRFWKKQVILVEVVVWIMLISCAVWAVSLGNTIVLEDKSLIIFPF